MRVRQLLSLSLLFITLVAVACTPQATPTSTPLPPTAAPPTRDETIVLAAITDDPVQRTEQYQPLADYLAANLSEFGIRVGEVRIAPDMETLIRWVNEGEVDLYFDSAYPALILSDAADIQPFLRRWRNDVGEYHSVIFALKESGLTQLSDLKGKRVGFEEAISTSGYMLPYAYMVEAGLQVSEKSSETVPVATEEVGFIFTGDDENTIQWVLSGKVDAGVTDNLNYADIAEETREKLVILAETETLPRQIAMVYGKMPADRMAAVKKLLIGLDKTPEGPDILNKFQSTAKFDEFPGGTESALTRMRELFDIAQGKKVAEPTAPDTAGRF